MTAVVETCPCGAHITVAAPYTGRLAQFREAHAICREKPQGRREVTDPMTYRATAELHREMCGCAASQGTGEGVPWCDSIWPVRARRIVVAAFQDSQSRQEVDRGSD